MKAVKSTMAIRLCITCMVMVWSISGIAQEPIKEGIFTINDVTYQVNRNDHYSFYSIFRIPRPKLPKNRTVVNDIPLDYIQKRLTNQEVWRQLAKEVLGPERVSLLKQNKDILKLTFYFKPNGSLFFTTYSIKVRSLLTIEDIARIDQALMKDYKGTFASINDGHKYLSQFAINSELNFKD